MKINSMKLTVIICLLVIVVGILAGLFHKQIPPGNEKGTLMILGSLTTILITAINDLFTKKEH